MGWSMKDRYHTSALSMGAATVRDTAPVKRRSILGPSILKEWSLVAKGFSVGRTASFEGKKRGQQLALSHAMGVTSIDDADDVRHRIGSMKRVHSA